jgi:hypothetical protein
MAHSGHGVQGGQGMQGGQGISFSFMQNIKQYRKTYAEIIKSPKTTFEQPIFGQIIHRVKLRYNIGIDSEIYPQPEINEPAHFFSNNDIKIEFLEKVKAPSTTIFTLQWCTVTDIVSYLIKSEVAVQNANPASLYSLFIEVNEINNHQEALLYNDTVIPIDLIENIEKNVCMQVLQDESTGEINRTHLPFLYSIRSELLAELEKIESHIISLMREDEMQDGFESGISQLAQTEEPCGVPTSDEHDGVSNANEHDGVATSDELNHK